MNGWRRIVVNGWIKRAIENDLAALIHGIKTLYNCREVVVVEDTGEIWIANPQRGHWLDDNELRRIECALQVGDI